MEVFLRVWAAAQQSSSGLGSAFALHHPCQCYSKTGGCGKCAQSECTGS